MTEFGPLIYRASAFEGRNRRDRTGEIHRLSKRIQTGDFMSDRFEDLPDEIQQRVMSFIGDREDGTLDDEAMKG